MLVSPWEKGSASVAKIQYELACSLYANCATIEYIMINKPTGYVYIITCEGTSRIKIGHSGNPEKRRRELQTGAPGVLAIACTWMAYQSDEVKVHRALTEYRLHLEWFGISVELASEVITKTLGRPNVPVLKQDDLVKIQTPLMAKWEQVPVEDELMFIADLSTAIERLAIFPGVKKEIVQSKRRIRQMLEDGEVDALAMFDLCAYTDPLRRHRESYVSQVCNFIYQKAYPIGTRLLSKSEQAAK